MTEALTTGAHSNTVARAVRSQPPRLFDLQGDQPRHNPCTGLRERQRDFARKRGFGALGRRPAGDDHAAIRDSPQDRQPREALARTRKRRRGLSAAFRLNRWAGPLWNRLGNSAG